MKTAYWIALVLAMPLAADAASYVTDKELEDRQEEAKAKKVEAALATYVGRRFWFVPNANALTPIFFLLAEKIGNPDVLLRHYSFRQSMSKIRPDAATSFTLISLVSADEVPSNPPFTWYYKVRFEDGVEAYLEADSLVLVTKSPFDHLYDGGLRNDREEYIYLEDPRLIERRATAKAKAAKDSELERSARGGVRIGMSKEEVLRSNWGRPITINKTTTAHSRREQWVYGGKNYLYFENGILVSIQN